MDADPTFMRKLVASLRYAIKEADGWHDDCYGGPLDTDEMNAVRRILLRAECLIYPITREGVNS